MDDGMMLLKAVIRAKAKEHACNRAFADYLLDRLPASAKRPLDVTVWFRTRGGRVTLSRAILAGSPFVRVECCRVFRTHTLSMRSLFRATDADAWQVLCACMSVFRN